MPLTGCETTRSHSTEFVKPNIPESLRSCPDDPETPPEGSTQVDASRYITELYGALETCRGNNASIDRILDNFERRVDEHNASVE